MILFINPSQRIYDNSSISRSEHRSRVLKLSDLIMLSNLSSLICSLKMCHLSILLCWSV